MIKLVLKKSVEPNVGNVQFPEDFYRFGQISGTVDIPDAQIQKWIHTGLQEIKHEPFWAVRNGNTTVIILNYDDEYEVIVAKNYWEWSIPKS